MKASRAAVRTSALAALVAGALPFLVSVAAWPEIVTPAWFVTEGLTLYDHILFPHTPGLILLTALAAGTLGFQAAVLRLVPALALAAAAALLVAGARPHRVSKSGILAGFFAGVPLLVLLCVYTEGPALWPEPFLAPFFLAGVLLLERHERTGAPRALLLAGLVFGLAILVKQTAAWPLAGALAWLATRSRRRSLRGAATFAAAAAIPYAVFVVAWGLAFRTLAHVRWTLVYPVFSDLSREIATPITLADAHEAVVLALPLAALLLAEAALGRGARLRTPLVAVAAATAGMAWPRFGLLHLAGATGLLALASSRGLLLLWAAALRPRRRWRARPLAALTLSGTVQAILAGVAVLGAGPLLLDSARGPVFHWDDSSSRALAESIRARVPRGGELLVYDAHQALYPLTGTRAPGGLYVNPHFWYCLKRDRGDERLVAALAARPGLPVLYREPLADVDQVRATRTYAFLAARSVADAPAPAAASWRRITAPP